VTHADKLYRDEGWQIITDAALGIPPTDVESQARTVARWSHEEITRLRALNAELVDALEACPLPSTMGNVKTHYGRFYDWYHKYVERALAKAEGREP
jgi:hypothetical protein